MQVTARILRWFVFAAGPLVLLSYVIGFARADNPEDLWGGVDGVMRAVTVPFMFVAAAGFITAAYVVLFKMSEGEVAGLHWPWSTADGRGGARLLAAYAVYLIPSMLWLEATLMHIAYGAVWSQALTIGVLTLVSVGLLMMALLAWGAIRDGVPRAKLWVAAIVGMAIQSTINDNIIWVLEFPW